MGRFVKSIDLTNQSIVSSGMSDLARLLSALGRLESDLRTSAPARPGRGRVTENQLRILEELDEEDPVMVTELADVLGVTASTMSLNLGRLVDEGLVIRSRDPIDRRVRNVRLTREGAALVEERDGLDAVRAAAALERLRPDRRREVVEAVVLLAASAKAVADRHDAYLRGLTGHVQESNG